MSVRLRPFRIGELEIPLPVVLAPLAGYSDLPYRLICRRLGAPYCATEMMLDRLLLSRGRHQARLLATDEDDHPIAGQIIGSDPAVMAEAAKVLCRIGFDVVDLNFACPVNKALRRRRGGYLMKDPELVERIVRSVVDVSDRPVTVKIRQKFREADTSEAGLEIAARSFDAGAAAVTVHARSVEAKYAGPADWAFLADLRARLPGRTMLGSGDILTAADALRMLRETGVDAVLAARGALGNPWFFRQVRDLADGRPPYRPAIDEQRRLLEGHFAHACEFYGALRGPRIMRGFGIKYARMHPAPKQLRMAFVEVKRSEDWNAVLETFYSAEYDAQGRARAEAGPDAPEETET
ncbi:MAG TPA: tRNA-dihydrouridine synthase [Phycisphaerae bacterium]|nr:tRNA-dihydrouridine synthase [Phycisphaerae bacterium]